MLPPVPDMQGCRTLPLWRLAAAISHGASRQAHLQDPGSWVIDPLWWGMCQCQAPLGPVPNSGFAWCSSTTFTVSCRVQAAPCSLSCVITSGAFWTPLLHHVVPQHPVVQGACSRWCSQGCCAACRVKTLLVPMCNRALDSVLHARRLPELQGQAAICSGCTWERPGICRVQQRMCPHAMWHWPSTAWVISSGLCADGSNGHDACRGMGRCATGCHSACRVKAAHVPTRNRVLDDVLNREESQMSAEDLAVRRQRWQQWQANEKTITQGMERALNLQHSLGSPAGERRSCLRGGLGSLCRLVLQSCAPSQPRHSSDGLAG